MMLMYALSPEAKATVPRLSLQDIERKCRELPIDVMQDGLGPADEGVAVLTHCVPSNGILYLDLALDFSGISHDDLALVPLFIGYIYTQNTILCNHGLH